MMRLRAGMGERVAGWAVIAMTLLWLAACSSSGSGTDSETSNPPGSDSGTPNPPDPAPGPATPTGCETHAIEGGGRHKLSGIISGIDIDGQQLVVGSTSFTTTGASIVVDGHPATLESLHKGEIVTVTGTIDGTQQTGCATAVFADATLIGQVQAIDRAAQTVSDIIAARIIRPRARLARSL